MLEAAQYKDNCFVTLTYSPENEPEDRSVSPAVLSAFMKRLREKCDGKVRYFGVGEYGEANGRPHYHLALFNYPKCIRGYTKFRDGRCCATCDAILSAWQGKGHIFVGDLTVQSAAYVAGYVTKKWTNKDDPRLGGRKPEFARMSLRPGIGLGMMHEVASMLMTTKADERMIDVPLTLRHGAKEFPLGRYLRRALRRMVGRDEKEPEEARILRELKMHELREAAEVAGKPVKKYLDEKSRDAANAVEWKGEVLKGRRPL